MSFYIEMPYNEKSTLSHKISWHVQSKKPDIPIDNIIILQADGHEMFKILDLFSIQDVNGINTLTIPFSRQPIQRWYGDIAKTIFYALD